MPPETQTPEKTAAETPKTDGPSPAEIAQQIAQLTEQNKKLMEKVDQTDAWKQGVEAAVTGGKPVVTDKNAEAFQKVITNTADTLDDLKRQAITEATQNIRQELATKAYVESLHKKFEEANPNMKPLKDEVFALASSIVQQGQQNKKPVDDMSALEQATKYYQEKQKNLLALGGAGAGVGGSGFMESGVMGDGRYKGCQEDLFSLSDKEFAPMIKAKLKDVKAQARRFGR